MSAMLLFLRHHHKQAKPKQEDYLFLPTPIDSLQIKNARPEVRSRYQFQQYNDRVMNSLFEYEPIQRTAQGQSAPSRQLKE